VAASDARRYGVGRWLAARGKPPEYIGPDLTEASMTEIAYSLLLFIVLIGAAWICMKLQRLRPEHH
jgi:hypothetical protein